MSGASGTPHQKRDFGTSLISLRREPGGQLEAFAVHGRWDEVERLVQDVAWRYWQISFTRLEACATRSSAPTPRTARPRVDPSTLRRPRPA